MKVPIKMSHNMKAMICILIIVCPIILISIGCGPKTKIMQITYQDDSLFIECIVSEILYSNNKDTTYIFAELSIKNNTKSKTLIFNLRNLYLCSAYDTSNYIEYPSEPVTKLIMDEIFYSGRSKTKSVYWFFNNHISRQSLDSMRLFYKYNDPEMSRRLIW